MKRLVTCIFTAITALAICSCGGMSEYGNSGNTAGNAPTNTNTADKPTSAAPTKETLGSLEGKAFEAWKNKDGKFFEGFLTDSFVMFGDSGRYDKASSIKEIAESKCEVNSYSLSDEEVKAVGPDVAIFTFKATADYTCDGKKGPSPAWASTIYVRSGDTWKAAYHSEAPVPDPKAKPAPAPAAKSTDADAKPDALTETLLAVEKTGWEAWRNRDAKPVEELFSKDFIYVSGSGRMNKAEAIKAWFESKCDVKSFSLEQGKAVQLTPTVGLLTFRGNAEGTCDGNPLMSLWGSTLFLKEGEKWTPVFYSDKM